MSDIRTQKPVGQTNKTTEQQQRPGHEAQGFSLAQRVLAIGRSVASDLKRCIMDAWHLDIGARDACRKYLLRSARDAKKDSEGIENLSHLDAGRKVGTAARRIVNSGYQRATQFSVILQAMNAGMTEETVARALGQESVEHVGFDTICEQARYHLKTQAAGSKAGRKADPLAVALHKWLEARKAKEHTPDDEQVIAAVEQVIAPMLPKDDDTPAEDLAETLKASLRKPARKAQPVAA